jgi:hypothetical protein
MMGYKAIERLEGWGIMRRPDASEIGKRRYHLTVWQHMLDDGRGGEIPGLFSIEGKVQLDGHEGFTLVAEGAELTLTLEDGRTLPFFFSNGDGQIAARGRLA